MATCDLTHSRMSTSIACIVYRRSPDEAGCKRVVSLLITKLMRSTQVPSYTEPDIEYSYQVYCAVALFIFCVHLGLSDLGVGGRSRAEIRT